MHPYVPVDQPKYFIWSTPIWWPFLTTIPAILLPIPLIAFYKDTFTRRPGRVPVSFLLIPLWMLASGFATVASVLVSGEEHFLESDYGRVNMIAWGFVLGPLVFHLLLMAFNNCISIVFNPVLPQSWRVKNH